MKGYLRERRLDALLHMLRARGASGVLTLERKPVKKQICLLKGTVRLAVSSRHDERLAESLVRHRILPLDSIHALEKRAASEGKMLVDLLVATGTISIPDLNALVRGHVLDLVLNCYDWEDGEYRFTDGMPNMVGEVTVEILPIEITLERFRRSSPDGPMRRLQANPGSVLIPSPQADADLQRVKLTRAESFVVTHAVGKRTVRALLDDSPEEESATMRAIAALIASGIVALAPPPQVRPADPSRARGPGIPATRGSSGSRAEEDSGASDALLAHYQRMYELLLGADHYKTLNVGPAAAADEIRAAYYALAKEVHPDRFLSPPLDVLHAKMEELFSQILDAYRTLTNPADRERYDAERLVSAQAPKQTLSEQQQVARQNYLRGRALAEMGKMTEAVKFLGNAAELDPIRGEYWRTLAIAQAGNPRMRREAVENFLKAIEHEPAHADTYLQLALLYRRMGDPAKAEQNLRECLKWEPANSTAARALEEITAKGASRS